MIGQEALTKLEPEHVIECRLATSRDKSKWNDFVQALAKKGVYGTLYDWKEIMEDNTDERGLFVVAERSGEIVGVYPGFLTSRFMGRFSRLPLAKRVLRRLIGSEGFYGWDYGGPCAKDNDAEVVDALVSFMDSEARNQGVTDALIMPYLGDATAEQVAGRSLSSQGYREDRTTPWPLSQTMDLTRNEKDLMGDFSQHHRESAIKFSEMGFEIVEEPAESVEQFYDCIRRIMARVHERSQVQLTMPKLDFFRALLAPRCPPVARLFSVRRGDVAYEFSLDTYLHDLVCDKWGGSLNFVKGLSIDAGFCYQNMMAHKRREFRVYDNCWLPRSRTGSLYTFKVRCGGVVREVAQYSRVFSRPKFLALKAPRFALTKLRTGPSTVVRTVVQGKSRMQATLLELNLQPTTVASREVATEFGALTIGQATVSDLEEALSQFSKEFSYQTTELRRKQTDELVKHWRKLPFLQTVAKVDSELVGWLVGWVTGAFSGGASYDLQWTVVDPRYRGHSIYKEMLSYFMNDILPNYPVVRRITGDPIHPAILKAHLDAGFELKKTTQTTKFTVSHVEKKVHCDRRDRPAGC